MGDIKWTLPNGEEASFSKRDMEPGKYYKVLSNIDKDFLMIGKALSEEHREGDNYWAEATFISPNRPIKFQKNKRWCYRNETRVCLPAEDHEIDWLNHCIENDSFISKSVYNQRKYNEKVRELSWENLKKGEYYKLHHVTKENRFSIIKFGEYAILPEDDLTTQKFKIWSSMSFKNKDYRHRIERPTGREVDWLDACIKEGKFISYNEFKANLYKKAYTETKPKLEKFPNHGWCPNPSKEVLIHIFENFNEKKRFKPGKMGIAWNNKSAWKIEGSSSYTKYSNEELEKVLPKIVCVDLEAGKGLFDKADTVFPVWQGARSVGKTSFMNKMMEEYLGKPIHVAREGSIDHFKMEQEREFEYRKRMRDLKEQEMMRQALRPNYHNDYFVSAAMAMQAVGRTKRKDEFTQQEPVVLKSNKKRRKLIFS